jgi:hypothetical protein
MEPIAADILKQFIAVLEQTKYPCVYQFHNEVCNFYELQLLMSSGSTLRMSFTIFTRISVSLQGKFLLCGVSILPEFYSSF